MQRTFRLARCQIQQTKLGTDENTVIHQDIKEEGEEDDTSDVGGFSWGISFLISIVIGDYFAFLSSDVWSTLLGNDHTIFIGTGATTEIAVSARSICFIRYLSNLDVVSPAGFRTSWCGKKKNISKTSWKQLLVS